MKYGMYSIYDRLVCFNTPFILRSDEIAQREFTNICKANPNKKDLYLMKIGEFYEETGEIVAYKKEEFAMLGRGEDIV